jgi:hypothetical protein
VPISASRPPPGAKAHHDGLAAQALMTRLCLDVA